MSVSSSSFALTKGYRSKCQLFYPLRWPIYVFNSVVNTKLPVILSHRRSSTVSLETYPLTLYFQLCLFPQLNFSHVLSPVHGLLCVFDLPIAFSVASLYVTKILSYSSWCSGSSISPSASNLFFTSMLYLLLISSPRSFHTSNFILVF